MKLLKLLLQHRVRTAIVLILLIAGGWFVQIHQHDLSQEVIIEFGKRIHAVWFIVLFFILPLAGFPLSILLVLAGIRFGFTGGMAVSSVAVFFHNFTAYHLSHGLFRDQMRNFLERAGYAISPISPGHRIKLTALFAAIHGPPYFAKLYLLALTDIPFRIYFWVGAPVYVAFCAIPVGAGSAVTQFDATWIYAIIAALAILSLAGYWLRRRIAQH
jgi:uncharacterized membrane protein YdjX (TVP38/TMEM64 family)